eukprot:3122560-Rhodomonas_salina.1
MVVNCPVVSDEDLSVMKFTCSLDLCAEACKVDNYLLEADVYIVIAAARIASSKASTAFESKKHTRPLEGEMIVV